MSAEFSNVVNWRERHIRLRLTGTLHDDGTVSFGIGPHRPRFFPNGNGHHPEEDPLKAPQMTEISLPSGNDNNGQFPDKAHR